ncbi:sensor histidine kinase [Agromyces sp. SYSU T0242]|uniref:sensor histidine kinase n=1 Tax=Agromyces litoreus TaxID=3158561 RepID=UPI0033945C83
MTLGLPEHLARASLSRAMASAGHAAGAVCLASALVIATAGFITAPPDGPAGRGPATVALALLLVQGALFALVVARPTVTLTVAYLLGGTAAVFGLTVIVMAPGNAFETTNNALLAMPRTALLLVGGAGIGSRIAIAWACLGWGLGEAASLLGAAVVGAAWAPNVAATAAIVLVVVVRTYDAASRTDDRRETALHRASQQTRELVIRHDYEIRAIARLHDTALSHLVAVASSGSGPVDERLRAGIRHDLSLIVGRDWAAEHGDEPAAAPSASSGAGDAPGTVTTPSWSARLPQALAVAGDAGLSVRLSGPVGALERLGPIRLAVLDAALAQCLVNVVRHAGVDDVEVAVGAADGEVTVVVVDSGRGFDPALVPDDRIGLRTSIRARIEQEGGSARVWSTPGVGTTVLLSVPERGE